MENTAIQNIHSYTFSNDTS